MNNVVSFSVFLRQHRNRRGVSLEQLAIGVGVSKATLSNWEVGRTRPSGPELESLIAVLGLREGEQLFLRRLVACSRSLASLAPDERPPLTGGLLRALRLRRWLTQSEVARRLEVRQGTLAKWEASEDWPSPERLLALCAVLGARSEETEAILNGAFLPLPLSPETPWEQVVAHVTALIHESIHSPCHPLLDLRFLELESLLWLMADQPQREALLWEVWSSHALFLHLQDRGEEARHYTERLLRVSYNPDDPTTVPLQVARIHQAKLLRKRSPAAAVLALQQSESRVRLPECRAWYWMYLGELLITLGRGDEALRCIDCSNAVAHPDGPRIETTEACFMTASHLIDLGQAQAGLTLLTSPAVVPAVYPQGLPRRLLCRAKGLALLGERQEAESLLRWSDQLIAEHTLPFLQGRRDEVAALVERGIRKI